MKLNGVLPQALRDCITGLISGIRSQSTGQNGGHEVLEAGFVAFSCGFMHFWLQEWGTEKGGASYA